VKKVLLVGALLAATPTYAAEIQAYHNCGYGFPNCIVLRGEIKDTWDFMKLNYETSKFMRRNQYGISVVADPTALFLDSPGGSVRVGLEMIALLVMRWSMATIVPENAVCASMCANIWPSGHKNEYAAPNIDRYVAPSGRIGFHTTSRNGRRSKYGNDEIKEFYRIMNLARPPGQEMFTETTMNALVAPDPDDMLWLTPEIGEKLGIEYESWPPK
jgi:hypothetical protein